MRLTGIPDSYVLAQGTTTASEMQLANGNLHTYTPALEAHFTAAQSIYPAYYSFPSADRPTDAENTVTTIQSTDYIVMEFYQLSGPDRELIVKGGNFQGVNAQDLHATQAAINYIKHCNEAQTLGGSYEPPQAIQSALMQRVERPPAETGRGSRHGCEYWVCHWPGCLKKTKRKPNATKHLLAHTHCKPEACPVDGW